MQRGGKKLLWFSQAVLLLRWSHPSLVGDPFALMPVSCIVHGQDLAPWLFLIHSIHFLSPNCALQLKRQIFSGEQGGKFHPFGWLEREPVASCFFVQPGMAFLSCCISAFIDFPCVTIMNHKFKNNCIRCVHMAGQHALRSKERDYVFPLPWAFQEPSLILCWRKIKLLGN